MRIHVVCPVRIAQPADVGAHRPQGSPVAEPDIRDALVLRLENARFLNKMSPH
jgi:hypothetical protein